MVTRHPLLRPAIAFVAGIAFAGFWSIDWRGGFGIAAIAASLAWMFASRRTLLAMASWLFIGASLMSFRMEARDPDDLRNILGADSEMVTVRGVLDGDPEQQTLEHDRRSRYRTTARVRVSEIERHHMWQPASGEIAVSTPDFVEEPFLAGSRVEIAGVLASPQGPTAPGLFDFEQYLKWQRIYFVLRTESTNDWKWIQPSESWTGAPIYRRFNEWARHTLRRGIPYDENTRLLWAMVLGWKPGLTNEIAQPFMRTGTLHIFAISGLHIALIAALFIGFQRGMWIPGFVIHWWSKFIPEVNLGLSRAWAGATAIPVIWFYTGATGWQASAIRSTIMSTVVILGWISKRPHNLLNSLSAAGLLILLWQPEQLFQPGFQLSFLLLATFGIWPAMPPNNPWPNPTVYLGQAEQNPWDDPKQRNAWTWLLAKVYEKLTGQDPFLPRHLRPDWRQKLDWLPAWLLNGLNISIAALLGSLPVVAAYFNLVSFSSLMANLVIVPISGIALGASLVSLIFASAPWIPEWANFISWETMRFMVWFCRSLESFHWTYRYVEAPGPLAVVAYYLVFLGVVLGWMRKRVVAVAISALALFVMVRAVWNEQTTTSVTLLPGAGVVFVDAPGVRNDFLVDCGRDRDAATLIGPFLRGRGVDSLPTIILTHGSVERVEGYWRLAEEFSVRTTITSAARSRSPKYREILGELAEHPQRWRKVVAGDLVSGWTVWHPAYGEDFQKAEDDSIVLSREIAGVRIVLLSELGRAGQQRLAQSERAAHAAVVLAGFPTEGQPLERALFQTLQPKVVLLGGRHPRGPKMVRELNARGASTASTMEQQAITLRARRGTLTIEGMRGFRHDF